MIEIDYWRAINGLDAGDEGGQEGQGGQKIEFFFGPLELATGRMIVIGWVGEMVVDNDDGRDDW
jgi:hypothetical protein